MLSLGKELTFINRHATEPFFLYLAYNAVHKPYDHASCRSIWSGLHILPIPTGNVTRQWWSRWTTALGRC